MKKLAVVADITFLLTFFGLFIYFYKSSGKFRKSIIAAFVAVSFYFSGLNPAHSAGEADAFTPQNQQHQSRPQKEGFFSRKSNNNRPGPGKGKPNGDGSGGDDGGIPNYPQSESVEETQKRVEWMQEQVRKLEEETESEEDQCYQQNKAGAGNGGGAAEFDDQCPIPKKEQSQESDTLDHGLTSKSKKKKKQSKLDKLAKPDLSLDAKQQILENPQLLELSIDPRNGQIDKQSFDEAESIMQAQRETGLFDDARRPNSQKGERDIDFILSGSFYDEADIKTPKSFFDTKKGPKKPIPQDMLDYLARDSGAKSILQKRGSESCLHILDLKDIQPHQKESYKANFLQGAREADPELAKHIIVQND